MAEANKNLQPNLEEKKSTSDPIKEFEERLK